MSRIVLSRYAKLDLDELRAYFQSIPKTPALRLGKSIQHLLESIKSYPHLGSLQSELTRIAGFEVRSRVVNSYRILYVAGDKTTEILGILHTSRDIRSILVDRLQ